MCEQEAAHEGVVVSHILRNIDLGSLVHRLNFIDNIDTIAYVDDLVILPTGKIVNVR